MRKSMMSFLAICILSGFVVGISAASGKGRYGGSDGMSIDKEWHTGINIIGNYTEGTASNRYDSPAYQKRVYVRSGENGSYSEWVSSGRHSITHKDFGPFGTDLYEVRFYWDFDQ